MMKSSSAPSWKSLQGGVVSEDSSSEEPDDDDAVTTEHSTVTTRRKRPHRTPPPTSMTSVTTRRRTSSASSASCEDAASTKSSSASGPSNSIARGGVACPFPWKLHDMLDLCSGERDPLVTWNSDGTAFCVLNAKAFVQTILPRFFAQTKYASFQRQLNLYGFTRYSMPLDASSNKSYSFYAHPHFLRGQRERVRCMIRCKIKGTGKKRHEDDEDDDGYHGDEKRFCQRDLTHESPTDPVEPLNDSFILPPEDGNVVETNEWKLESTVTMMLPPTDDEEAWVPSLTLDVNPDGTIEDGELAFFEGNPFHVLEPPTTHRLSSPKPLPLCMQPVAGGGGNDEYAQSVWSTTKNESWYLGDRSQLPKILNREQQRMILEPTSYVFHDRQVPWCTPNVAGILRTAQV